MNFVVSMSYHSDFIDIIEVEMHILFILINDLTGVSHFVNALSKKGG